MQFTMFVFGLFALLYVAAHWLRVVNWYNWRWNEGSWRARGLLADTGRGVVVRGARWGHYLRDRGWGDRGDATVFINERAARSAVAWLRLKPGADEAPGQPLVVYEQIADGRLPGERERRIALHNQRQNYRTAVEWADVNRAWHKAEREGRLPVPKSRKRAS